MHLNAGVKPTLFKARYVRRPLRRAARCRVEIRRSFGGRDA